MNQKFVKISDNKLNAIVKESVNKILGEAFSDLHQDNHIMAQKRAEDNEDFLSNDQIKNELLSVYHDIETSIKSCESKNCKAAIYDLSGALQTLKYLIRMLS